MSNNLISIIIPVYNIEKYLKECLDSILNQTYQNFEVILVDDCSTDSSFEICNEYALKDERIKVYQHQENSGGCGIPRNTGLKYAKGDYITFIDGDDLIEKNYLEVLVNNVSEDSISVATYYYKEINQKKQKAKHKNIPNNLILKTYFRGKYYTQAWGKLFPRKYVEDLEFPSFFFEDVPVIYKVLLKAKKLIVCYETYYIYRKRDESLTTSKKPKKYFPFLDELASIEDNLKKMKVSTKSLNAFYNYLIRSFLSFYRYSFTDMNDEVIKKRNEIKKYLRRNFFKLLFRCTLFVKFALLLFVISPSSFYYINHLRLLFKKNILRLPDIQL